MLVFCDGLPSQTAISCSTSWLLLSWLSAKSYQRQRIKKKDFTMNKMTKVSKLGTTCVTLDFPSTNRG